MDIENVLKSGGVERFHSAPEIANQRVDSHSWGVAMLIQHYWPDCRKELILAALTHDCGELVTGDIPATAKWMDEKLKYHAAALENRVMIDMGIQITLTKAEMIQLKICDAIDGILYCARRYNMGEKGAAVIARRWCGHLADKTKDTMWAELLKPIWGQINKLRGDMEI